MSLKTNLLYLFDFAFFTLFIICFLFFVVSREHSNEVLFIVHFNVFSLLQLLGDLEIGLLLLQRVLLVQQRSQALRAQRDVVRLSQPVNIFVNVHLRVVLLVVGSVHCSGLLVEQSSKKSAVIFTAHELWLDNTSQLIRALEICELFAVDDLLSHLSLRDAHAFELVENCNIHVRHAVFNLV